MTDINAEEAALIKVNRDECWLWAEELNPGGYAIHGQNLMHRVLYKNFVGEIPKGLHLDHLCRVRCCINPDHLEAVTPGENAIRGMSPYAKNARKTKCPNGHVYDKVYSRNRRSRGKTVYERVCSLCMYSQRKVRYWRKIELKYYQEELANA